MDPQEIQTRILTLVDRLDAAWAEVIRWRDVREAMRAEFRRFGKKTNPEAFDEMQRHLHDAVAQVTALRAALTALGAPSLPLDADFTGKLVRMDVMRKVIETAKLPPAELRALNDRVNAVTAEHEKEQKQRKAGGQ